MPFRSGRLALLIGAIVAWLALGFAGRATGIHVLDALAGMALVAAVATAVLLLLERRRGSRPPGPSERLFPPLGQGRWCDRCGHVTSAAGPCSACGHVHAAKRRRRDAS